MTGENGARVGSAAVEAAADPLVASVESHADWFDGDTALVALVGTPTDADARRMRC